jgi:hypothetical protein
MTTISIPSVIIVLAFAAVLAMTVGAALATITAVEKAFKAQISGTRASYR